MRSANTEINALELYSAFVGAAPSWPQPYHDLSAQEQENWKAFAELLGPRALATHVDPDDGSLYIVSPPGAEDGTIGAWQDGMWVTAESSGVFERSLVKLIW